MTTDAADGLEAKWGEWRAWSGGPCPIPWAQAGECRVRFGNGGETDEEPALFWSGGRVDWWKRSGIITAYRVRADLEHRLTDAPATGGVQITDEMVEAAAKAIVETWAAHESLELTWGEAVIAAQEPGLYPKLGKVAPLARLEARAALTAALAAAPRQTETPNV